MEFKTIYTADVIARLELGWGQGWLSPGGPDEVSLLMSSLDIEGKTVLDIGVGTGGPAALLLRKHGARHVTGVDIEQSVVEKALTLAVAQQLENRLDVRCIRPGPLPFEEGQFDVVFSKDSFVHIADKALLFDEIFRVLTPGGQCVFSDWCCGTPPYSTEMEQFFENGMNFTMATIEENCGHLQRAGFRNISSRDRNSWFADFAAREFQAAQGSKRARLVSEFGREAADRLTSAAERRAVITSQGHLRPAHFYAFKPDC